VALAGAALLVPLSTGVMEMRTASGPR